MNFLIQYYLTMWIYLTTKSNEQFDEKSIAAGDYCMGFTNTLGKRFINEVSVDEEVKVPKYDPTTAVAVYSVPVIYNFLQIVKYMSDPKWPRRAHEIKNIICNFNRYEPHMDNVVMDYLKHDINRYRTNVPATTVDTVYSMYLPMCHCGVPCMVFKTGGNGLYFKCNVTPHIRETCSMKEKYRPIDKLKRYTHSTQERDHYLKKSWWLYYIAVRSVQIKLKYCFSCDDTLYNETRVVYRNKQCNLCWDCLCTLNENLDSNFWLDHRHIYDTERLYWNCSWNYDPRRKASDADRRNMTLYDPTVDE